MARWFKIVKPIPYVFYTNSLGPLADGGRPGVFMPPMMPWDRGRIGEHYVTWAVGAEGVRRLLATGDLVDLGERYEQPPTFAIGFDYRWPDLPPEVWDARYKNSQEIPGQRR